ncbi:CrcB family protein [Fructilactobacillus ixorae]|uniref:Fluoride-specific ion channel FluC n=1 Tax=Fructilactobacillus ixorae TaxID=1750535 RepID=A0ABY5C4U5_9LACO|nr:CrcB family protein [Fructilactobacillus ixorae]USS93802.1 CrcB family protein [Fructilactobacillus ixorae]
MESLLVFIGGIIGGGLRIGFTDLLPAIGFPYVTLLINLVGAFILPIWNNYWAIKWHCQPTLRKGIGVGVIGSFTTFSGIMLDSSHLIMNHQFQSLLIYLAITIVGGFLLAVLGYQWSNRLREQEGI